MRELAPVQSLDQEAFAVAFDALKHRPQFSHGDVVFRLGKALGHGGTKSVYDARISGTPLALALPNTVDGRARAAQKWQEALREPPVTDVVRALGFLVNTRCEVTPINIDGTTFPALTMTRYADLPIEVRDRKNPHSSVVKSAIFSDTLTLGSFMESSQGLVQDTAALVKHGIILEADSFNLGRENKELRLFFNDLANAKFEELSEEDAARYAGQASMRAIQALQRGLTWEEYGKHSEFLESDAFHFQHGQAYKDFTDLVLVEAGISS